MSTSKGHLKDARGVDIHPGDTAIYGFGVSRSVAMAEAVVEADPRDPSRVSVTPSGRVRIRVVRRSYSDGQKPVVDVAADRMVVLKANFPLGLITLPNSPLPTQDEQNYGKLVTSMERYLDDIERLSSGGQLDEDERRGDYGKPLADPDDPERRAYWLDNYTRWERETRRELESVCARLGRSMPL